MSTARPFLLKFAETVCLFLVVIGLTQLSEATSRWQFGLVSDWTNWVPALTGLLAVSALIAYVWQRSGKGDRLHPIFQTIIAFYVANSIAGYGAAKILKTQFQPPRYIMETPIGDLSGFWLTWTYYGYSQTMAYILGWTQVIGCVLLLFRRTRLIGVFVLLPVMVNIDLIDHFYEISPLAYYNALHYTGLLVFLLLLDFDKLKVAFLSYQETISLNYKTVLINALRILVIGGAFWKIAELRNSFEPKSKLNGVWKVESISRNRQTIVPTAYQDSVWSKVYFEWRYGCLFKYHPDKFQTKDLHGQYEIDEKAKTMRINFPTEKGDPGDSARVHYQFINDTTLTMQGRYQNDSLVLKLRKLL